MDNSCILCGESKFTKLVHYDSFPIVLGAVAKNKVDKIPNYPLTMCFCNHCNHVQQINSIPKDISDTIYTDEYYGLTSSIETGIDLFTVNDFYKFFYSCNKIRGDILEIGCFDGNLLLKLYNDGLNIYGIDPSNATKSLQKKLPSGTIINDFFTEQTFKNKKYNSIIFRNLLEHLHDPNTFLKNVRNILKEEGYIFIDVPNFNSIIDSGGFGEYIHEHISSFTIETLTFLLKLHGFEIYKVREGDYFYVCAKKINLMMSKNDILVKTNNNKKTKEKAISIYSKLKNDFLSFFNSKDIKSIGIFGASSRTNALILLLNNKQLEKIKFIYDNDSGKHDKYISGFNIPIRSPKNIIKDKLDIILISTYLFEKEILDQIKLLPLEGLRVVTFHPELIIHSF